MDELQRGFEIAGTGVGVVFAALVSLAVVTTLMGRLLHGAEREPAAEAAVAPSADAEAEAVETAGGERVDPMMVAAMAAAVRFVRRGTGAARNSTARRQASEPTSAWRAQGRQSLMASQGSRVRPRNSRN
ncbi:MAG: OadG family protein [Chloroflexota bacterium]|nr:OadG family protein [Chloroflexota bacterium]MDE2969394.1 OadG family protein [Chloroflexota bacterium]